jgi:hypothetical protein
MMPRRDVYEEFLRTAIERRTASLDLSNVIVKLIIIF